ncbi:MAG TPA: hypothetical protein VK864_10325 [Longimicrobiales bacterium]|nr:hypothetical protein [Longimicrobiales bacterium]
MTEIPVPEPPNDRQSGNGGVLQRLQLLLTPFIALVAIGLAIWEGVENRRHNRLSVQPRIAAEINSGRDDGGEFIRMSIESTGLGPAVINTFRVYFDGVPQDTLGGPGTSVWQSALDAFGTSKTQINAHAIGRGHYLPAGTRHLLFEARRLQSDSTAPPLTTNLGRLALQICYCSVYDTDCDEVLLTTGALVPLRCTRER